MFFLSANKIRRIGLKCFGSFIEHGILGRKLQMICFLSQGEDNGYKVKRREWEEAYSNIEKKYTEIRLHRLWSTRIGEYVPRYLVALEDSQKNAKNGKLDVFVLSDCNNHNSRLSRIMSRYISIIDKENVDFWTYVLRRFPKVESYRFWEDYSERNKGRLFYSATTEHYFDLTQEEQEEGECKMVQMGVHEPFICVSSRDSTYLSHVCRDVDCRYHDCRDSDINKLKLAAEYCQDREIGMVRLGRDVGTKVNFKGCIDYANEYYDELMDIVLAKKCKFFVGDSHGLCSLPMVLNRPVALKNVVPAFVESFGSYPQNPENLMIFKKYFLKKENRFLSVAEMMKIDKIVKAGGTESYLQLGIEVVENSEEEILDLVSEMNERLDGNWRETPEDVKLQLEFKRLLTDWCKQEGLEEKIICIGKVGTKFLRKNSYLLPNTDCSQGEFRDKSEIGDR